MTKKPTVSTPLYAGLNCTFPVRNGENTEYGLNELAQFK